MNQLRLTDRSREIVSLMQKDIHETEKKLTEGFSEEEVAQLCQYLDRMIANMEK